MNGPNNLENRCIAFARDVGLFVHALPKSQANVEYGKQIIRSSGSIGANYLEACESLGKKDFVFRLRISKKEARETAYWLKLIQSANDKEQSRLLKESQELLYILAAIITKTADK